ncbi:hypothetical protein Tco_1437395 [Tanacetum coccineum]
MPLIEEAEVVAMKVETQEEFLSLIQVIVNFMSLIGVVFKHPLLKNFLYINGGQIPEASSKRSLHCHVTTSATISSTALLTGTDISQKDENPIKKRQNRTRDGKVCEIEAKSKSSLLREEKAKKNIT